MIGKLIGAYAGERAARHLDGVNGPAGALLGAGTATALKKIGPFGLMAALLGGYALKRRIDHRREGQDTSGSKSRAKRKKS